MDVRNRAELEYFFDSILNNNFLDISMKRKYSYGHNAVKSYIVESHNFKGNIDRESLLSSLDARAKQIDSASKINDTEEASLVHLETRTSNYYLDIGTPRYVVFHTANPTRQTDPFIKKFYNAPDYDCLWLPVPLLLKTTDIGKFWGMGVSYRAALAETLNEEDDPEDIQDVSLNIQRNFAKEFFDLLMNSNLNHMMGISRLSVLRSNYEKKGDQDKKFIIDDIKYNGKITAKGNSYSRHSRVIYELLKLYDEELKRYEKYCFSFEGDFLEGNPFTINFSREISPSKLVDFMFTGEEPFRLWGMEDELGNNQYRVYAVDLHHGNPGNKLTFEITSKYLRVSLPKGSCTNTLLRLFANLNHYVDAMAGLEVIDYELKVPRTGFSEHSS